MAGRAGDAEMSAADRSALALAVRDVSARIESMKFNTAVSALMVLANHMSGLGVIPRDMMAAYAKLLSPFAPHLADEIWEGLGGSGSLAFEPWPEFDPADISSESVTVVVQVNGKKRAEMDVAPGLAEAELAELAAPLVEKFTNGRPPRKTVVVPDKIVNFVV
jgi:leucyl-tRNA synthetase